MNKKAIGDKNSDDKSQQTRVAKKKAREQELELELRARSWRI